MKKEKLIKNFSFSALVQGNVHCFSGLLRPGVRIFVKKMAVGGAALIRRPRMRAKIRRKPWSVPRLRGRGEQG